MATSMVSVRTWILTACVLTAIGMSSFAGEVVSELAGETWYETTGPCNDGFAGLNGSACGNCVQGLDCNCCGDMTPLAMLPGGRWYFQSNLIAYRRDAGQDEVFQTRNQNVLTFDDTSGDITGVTPVVDPVLSTSDLDFQNSAGYRLLLGWRLAEKYAIEFSYFDLNDWNEFLAISDNTEYLPAAVDPLTGDVINPLTGVAPEADDIEPYSLFSPFSNFGDPPIPAFDFNDMASIRYRSSLDNVEINIRHSISRKPSRLAVSVLWGGRFNAVREEFTYFTSSAAPASGPGTNTVSIHTDNDLWGAQVGAQFDFCWDPGWHTEFEIKGGVAQNRAIQESTYTLNGEGPYWNRVEKDTTSWLGEMRLTLVYQFGQHLTTHIGYEALVLANVALASRNFQPDRSILASAPPTEQWVINVGGSVVYHGPSAGFTFAW